MEEILASIRRIISEDDEEAGAAPEGAAEPEMAAEPEPAEEPVFEPEEPAPAADPSDEDVLELTDVVGDDGNVVSLSEALAEDELASSEPKPSAFGSDTEPLEPVAAADPLLSETPEALAAGSVAELMAGLSSSTLLGDGDKTLEELVKDLLRPLMKRWLDDHLPPMVEQIVREELERVIARGRGR